MEEGFVYFLRVNFELLCADDEPFMVHAQKRRDSKFFYPINNFISFSEFNLVERVIYDDISQHKQAAAVARTRSQMPYFHYSARLNVNRKASGHSEKLTTSYIWCL